MCARALTECFIAAHKNGTSEHIKPSKEERIQRVLPKPDVLLTRLMPSSVIKAANSTICQ